MADVTITDEMVELIREGRRASGVVDVYGGKIAIVIRALKEQDNT